MWECKEWKSFLGGVVFWVLVVLEGVGYYGLFFGIWVKVKDDIGYIFLVRGVFYVVIFDYGF